MTFILLSFFSHLRKNMAIITAMVTVTTVVVKKTTTTVTTATATTAIALATVHHVIRKKLQPVRPPKIAVHIRRMNAVKHRLWLQMVSHMRKRKHKLLAIVHHLHLVQQPF